MQSNTVGKEKPIPLRIIFILNVLKILLTIGFFMAFRYYGFEAGELAGDAGARVMMYALIGYLVAFSAIVYSILKRSLMGLRTAIIADFAVSVLAVAPIGFVVAAISMLLSFNQAVKSYFSYRK